MKKNILTAISILFVLINKGYANNDSLRENYTLVNEKEIVGKECQNLIELAPKTNKSIANTRQSKLENPTVRSLVC